MSLELAPQVRELLSERGGALVAIGSTLGLPLPEERGISFDELLPVLLERSVAAFVPLA